MSGAKRGCGAVTGAKTLARRKKVAANGQKTPKLARFLNPPPPPPPHAGHYIDPRRVVRGASSRLNRPVPNRPLAQQADHAATALRRGVVSVCLARRVLAGLSALFLASVASCAYADALFLPVMPQDPPAVPAAGLGLDDNARSSASGGAWERRVRVARHELAIAREDVENAGAGRLLLNVKDGVRLNVVMGRTAPTKWGYSLSGRVAGGGVGFVTMVVHEDAVAGSIWTPSGSWELLPVGGGVHALRDVAKLPPVECGGMLQKKVDASDGVAPGVDDGSVVDILIVYTPAAEEKVEGWTGSPAAARSWIKAFNAMGIALANDAFERSGALVSLNLVGFEKVDYEAETREQDRLVLYSDSAKALRDRLGADLVHATVGCCFGASMGDGLSYLTAGSGAIFVAHEVGHDFWILHERHEFLGSSGPLGYGHGFTTEDCKLTIMSYGTDCYGRGSSFTRPPFYASPWRYTSGGGRPLGVARFSKERGARGPADAVLTLNRNRHRVANAVFDVSPLAGLASLTELHLAGNAVADASPLAGLTALTVLSLSGNTILDVSPLADLTALERLYLGYNAIADVSPLAGLTALTELDLAGNVISDVSLAGLTALAELDLAGNVISDVSLAGLTALAELDLAGNVISNVSLTGLTALMELDLAGNAVVDVSPLAGLTALTTLHLAGNAVVDVSPLAGLTALTTLHLSGNEISDVSALAGLTSLSYLDLLGNTISDIAPLVQNDGLDVGDSVNLIGNFLEQASRETHIPTLLQRGVKVQFTEFAGLQEMTDTALRRASRWALYAFLSNDLGSLESLDASDRGVEDLTGLEGAARLEGLFLDRNRITDISPLAALGSLRVLTLAHNRVQDWSPLAGMNSLRLLALDGNSLCELPPLPSSLYRLYLSNNCLSDIGPLANLWLWELDVSRNAITSLAPLANARYLEYLHVHDNRVADISSLHFESLREIHMANNAVRDISPLLGGEELLMVDVRRNPLADDALGVLETLRERGVTVLAGETVPYFPAAGDVRQGFVRIINRSGEAGHVFIEAVDDAGVRAGPVRMEIGARRAVHFNSRDLENGNAAKGLRGIGAPTAGDWRLSMISALDVEVLSYIRTGDGFVTAMHDVAADAMAPFFNPADNRNQRSILRVVNTEAEPAKWTTGGYDDRGSWRPMAGSLLVRPQHALTLTAEALENAHGMGDGRGKWRLRVRGFPWYAMSLLESPTGHLTNLSTTPDNATALADGRTLHRLPLFPAAGGSRQGFIRVINRSYSSGEVVIEAVDDAGVRSAPVRLTLRPRRAAHFNSMDLEAGNDAKGLSAGIGAGSGDWRLEFTSTLDLQVLSYIRTADGFLTSMHDLAPRSEDGDLWIPFFNPGANRNQVSHLRLVNSGDAPAEATITGVDDAGQTGDAVRVTIPARAARTFTAAELETGNAEGLSGALGDGKGKWRLHVATDADVDAMSLLSLPTGHLTNLSTTPRYAARPDQN